MSHATANEYRGSPAAMPSIPGTFLPVDFRCRLVYFRATFGFMGSQACICHLAD